MDTMVKHRHSLSKNQKWVIASTSSGFALENMDVLFLSFAMSSMIADLHLSGGAAGFISTITNLGMLVGGIAFGILGDKIGRVKTFSHTVIIFAIATALMAFANNIYMIYKNMPLLQIILNLPFLLVGFGMKILFFCLKGYGREYLAGIKNGFQLSSKGRKVSLALKHFPAYCKIQWELWVNIFRRI